MSFLNTLFMQAHNLRNQAAERERQRLLEDRAFQQQQNLDTARAMTETAKTVGQLQDQDFQRRMQTAQLQGQLAQGLGRPITGRGMRPAELEQAELGRDVRALEEADVAKQFGQQRELAEIRKQALPEEMEMKRRRLDISEKSLELREVEEARRREIHPYRIESLQERIIKQEMDNEFRQQDTLTGAAWKGTPPSGNAKDKIQVKYSGFLGTVAAMEGILQMRKTLTDLSGYAEYAQKHGALAAAKKFAENWKRAKAQVDQFKTSVKEEFGMGANFTAFEQRLTEGYGARDPTKLLETLDNIMEFKEEYVERAAQRFSPWLEIDTEKVKQVGLDVWKRASTKATKARATEALREMLKRQGKTPKQIDLTIRAMQKATADELEEGSF